MTPENGKAGQPTGVSLAAIDRAMQGGLGLHILPSLVDHARYRRDGDRDRLVLTRAVAAGE
jgi:hypothetical protein